MQNDFPRPGGGGGPDFLGEIIVDEGRRRRGHHWFGRSASENGTLGFQGKASGRWKDGGRRDFPRKREREREREAWLQSCELKIQRRTRWASGDEKGGGSSVEEG